MSMLFSEHSLGLYENFRVANVFDLSQFGLTNTIGNMKKPIIEQKRIAQKISFFVERFCPKHIPNKMTWKNIYIVFNILFCLLLNQSNASERDFAVCHIFSKSNS